MCCGFVFHKHTTTVGKQLLNRTVSTDESTETEYVDNGIQVPKIWGTGSCLKLLTAKLKIPLFPHIHMVIG